MKISDLVRGYMFGERADAIPQSFENLYQVHGFRDKEQWLIKPRILDMLFRQSPRTQQVRHVFHIMRRFGYHEELVVAAMNELMLRKRPLIWYNSGVRIEDSESPGLISLTPIGNGYIEKLFGEVVYDEHTLPWSYLSSRGPLGVWEFHQKLFEVDLSESQKAKNRYGSRFYFGIYSEERPSLSLRHAENLMVGLPFRLRTEDEYDPERVEWVRKKFLEELSPVPKRSFSL